MSPHLLTALMQIQLDMRNNPKAFTSRTALEVFKTNPAARWLYSEGIL